MPYRRTPLVQGQIYHVFNRSIAKKPIFKNYSDYNRILDLINYYRFKKPPLRFSQYKRLTKEQKEQFKHMLTAFTYGVPPHGGIAPGIDRLLMALMGEPSLREMMAFPKTGDGRDLMMRAPSPATEGQLNELNIAVNKKPRK